MSYLHREWAIDRTIEFVETFAEDNTEYDKFLVKEKCIEKVNQLFEKENVFPLGMEIIIVLQVFEELKIKGKDGKISVSRRWEPVYDDEIDKIALLSKINGTFIISKRENQKSDNPLKGAKIVTVKDKSVEMCNFMAEE